MYIIRVIIARRAALKSLSRRDMKTRRGEVRRSSHNITRACAISIVATLAVSGGETKNKTCGGGLGKRYLVVSELK